MSPRLITALALVAAPIVAFGGGWGDMPNGVWLTSELAWAQPLHPDGLDTAQIEALYAPPPRPAWCDADGMVYPPSATECQDFDADLDGWLLDFMDTSDVAMVADVEDPPTYCGGC